MKNYFIAIACKEELCIKCIKVHSKEHKIINLIQYYKEVKDLPSTINFKQNQNRHIKSKHCIISQFLLLHI